MAISLPEVISSVSEGTTPCIPASTTSVGLTNPVPHSRERLDDTTETSSTDMDFDTGDWTSQPRGPGGMATAGDRRSTGVPRVALLPLHRIAARRRLR
jgi:hypothetical protein